MGKQHDKELKGGGKGRGGRQVATLRIAIFGCSVCTDTALNQ